MIPLCVEEWLEAILECSHGDDIIYIEDAIIYIGETYEVPS